MHDVDRAASTERESSQSRRIQEIASEVLRLRLVQTQHKQLEEQLRKAADKLQQLPGEKMLQLRAYLDHGLRPVGGPGTLGHAINGGVNPESLLGLMECLCVVCDARLSTRRQEDLLLATRWLLEDPATLVERLIRLPAAPATQSRRLAPFLLSCDSNWRGHLGEAGQCYETLRHWLSCYYQFSLISNQMQATAEQLQQQEQLLAELSTEPEGSTGSTGGFATMPAPRSWRASSGGRRSSSVQSNSSTGSRRSPSPSGDRTTALGTRPSPRLGGGPATLSSRLSSTGRARVNSMYGTSQPSSGLHAPRVCSPVRSASPLQPSSSRTSLHRGTGGSETARAATDKVESSPRAPRYSTSGILGGGSSLGSARSSGVLGSGTALGSARSSALSARPGAPPPNPSPRHMDPPKTVAANRRQNVAAVRARRSPSRDPASGTSPRVQGAFLSRHTPHPAVGSSRIDEQAPDVAPIDGTGHSPAAHGASGVLEPALARSRSLQSITEPPDFTNGTTPPLSTRGTRDGVQPPNSARTRLSHGGIGGSNSRYGASATSPNARPQTTVRGPRHSGAPPAAGSGGTHFSSVASGPPRRVGGMTSSSPCNSSRFPSTRQLRPSESATVLRHSNAGGSVAAPAGSSGGSNVGASAGSATGGTAGTGAAGDAGSGGTVGESSISGSIGWQNSHGGHLRTQTPRSLAASRSTPALDMRTVSGRVTQSLSNQASIRNTPDQTPRPAVSARLR